VTGLAGFMVGGGHSAARCELPPRGRVFIGGFTALPG